MKIPMLRPTRFEMQVLGIIHRILKSVGFNIFLLIVGYIAGFLTLAFEVHCQAIANPRYEIVARLESKIQELEKLDKKYTEEEQEIKEIIDEFKVNISHDNCNFKRLNPFK